MERVLEPEVMDTEEDAEEYDQMDNAQANLAFVERLVELGAYGRMLDIGTGPGHIPLLVCERIPDASVVGIDLARNMLEYAERHLARSPYVDRVEFRHADAKGLEFEDASFDTVFSNTILHHIPEPEAFLAEALRVLRPGGVLLVRDLYRPPTLERAQELVRLHAGEASPYQARLFLDSLKAALTPDELSEILERLDPEGWQLTIDSDRHMSLQLAQGRAS